MINLMFDRKIKYSRDVREGHRIKIGKYFSLRAIRKIPHMKCENHTIEKELMIQPEMI